MIRRTEKFKIVNYPYSLVIQWSEIDRCFVVPLLEFTDIYQFTE